MLYNPRQIQRKTNNFFMIPKAEAMLSLAERIEKIYSNKEEESLYINNIKKMDLVGTAEYAKKADREQVNSESMCKICIWSRLEIQ